MSQPFMTRNRKPFLSRRSRCVRDRSVARIAPACCRWSFARAFSDSASFSEGVDNGGLLSFFCRAHISFLCCTPISLLCREQGRGLWVEVACRSSGHKFKPSGHNLWFSEQKPKPLLYRERGRKPSDREKGLETSAVQRKRCEKRRMEHNCPVRCACTQEVVGRSDRSSEERRRKNADRWRRTDRVGDI
jgi:hypothetical protein